MHVDRPVEAARKARVRRAELLELARLRAARQPAGDEERLPLASGRRPLELGDGGGERVLARVVQPARDRQRRRLDDDRRTAAAACTSASSGSPSSGKRSASRTAAATSATASPGGGGRSTTASSGASATVEPRAGEQRDPLHYGSAR